jgi:nucleotide-binding universal stress UspA family protein
MSRLNSSPYRRVAVASTFSPRFLQVMAEAARVGKHFGAELSVIFVGENSPETAAKFNDAFEQLRLPRDTPIHFQKGEPASGILDAVRENDLDMVMAGALEKEVVLHPFLGNVARQLVREAPCSVMLFTHPDTQPKPLRKMVFVAENSDHARTALQRTFTLASAEKSERLYVIRVVTAFDQARASLGGDALKTQDGEEADLENFVLSAGPTEVPIEARSVSGNTGFAAADFVQSVGADLLVVPEPPTAGLSLPANVGWITDVIPCNLWVVR